MWLQYNGQSDVLPKVFILFIHPITCWFALGIGKFNFVHLFNMNRILKKNKGINKISVEKLLRSYLRFNHLELITTST